MKTRPPIDRAIREIERACAAATSGDELLELVSAEMHRLVPHDAGLWFGIDPATLLATTPALVEGFDASGCQPFWDREFNEIDLAPLLEVASGAVPTFGLRLFTDDAPARSLRFREMMVPAGLDDELRAALRAGASTWGVVGLYREKGRPRFEREDLDLVDAVSGVIAATLRQHARSSCSWAGGLQEPGLVVINRHLQIVSANAEALGWLRSLSRELASNPKAELPSPIGTLVDVATPLAALAARARAVTAGYERKPARLRLRDARGRWLVLHASCLSGIDERTDQDVAVVIEPAKSAEIAPIIVEAYSLTPREREVVAALARGGTAAEIAAELFLSPHTVRDHIKTVFEKVGVSSRAELSAKLFADHYFEPIHRGAAHA